jgi:hypothetical protein
VAAKNDGAAVLANSRVGRSSARNGPTAAVWATQATVSRLLAVRAGARDRLEPVWPRGVAERRPPCACTIERLIASAILMPPGLVVWKASNIRWRRSGGTPTPLSRTETRMKEVSLGNASMRSSPTCGDTTQRVDAVHHQVDHDLLEPHAIRPNAR